MVHPQKLETGILRLKANAVDRNNQEQDQAAKLFGTVGPKSLSIRSVEEERLSYEDEIEIGFIQFSDAALKILEKFRKAESENKAIQNILETIASIYESLSIINHDKRFPNQAIYSARKSLEIKSNNIEVRRLKEYIESRQEKKQVLLSKVEELLNQAEKFYTEKLSYGSRKRKCLSNISKNFID